MAFSATLDEIPLSAWLVFLATIIWTVIYDTIYAMVDREDDLKINVKSTAILFGKYDLIIIFLLHLLLIVILVMISQEFQLGNYFNMAIVITTLLMFYHQHLIKDRDRAKCFKAFLNNHYIGIVILLGIVLSF
jgi:4-hydroxybenzoate polyprenyltransferase